MRTVRLLGTLLFGALLLAQIALALTMSLASHTGYRVMVITGGSMEPTYHLGSALLLKDLPEDAIEVGTPVTFSSAEGTLTTHRVIDMPRQRGVQYLQTQGDANADPDPNFVSAAAVVGTPVAHLPYGGYVATYLLSPLGRLLVFGPPLAALLMVQVRLIRATLRNTATGTAAGTGPVTGPDVPARAVRASRHPRAVPATAGGIRVAITPLVVAVLIGSAAAGTLLARSSAMFTAVSHSANSTISTGTSGSPTALTASRVNGRNNLSWTAPSWAPADGYRIYRAASTAGPFTQIAQVDIIQTTYSDSGGNANSVYQVRGVTGAQVSEPAGPVGVK